MACVFFSVLSRVFVNTCSTGGTRLWNHNSLHKLFTKMTTSLTVLSGFVV